MDRKSLFLDSASDSILSTAQQKKVLKVVATITILIFIPLGIKNLIIGEIMLGAVLLSFELSLLAEIAAIIYSRRSIVGHIVPLCLLITSLLLSVHIFGTLATYWVYPVVISVIFLLPENRYLPANVIIIAGSSIVALPHQDPAETLRFFISLITCLIIGHYVVKSIMNLHNELHYLSTRDAMTGALNRRQLDSFLQRSLRQSSSSTVAMIDIDRFKTVNDLYGHDVGDDVINKVVMTIKSSTRTQDALFRLGGDEFLLLLNDADQNSAHIAMRKVFSQIKDITFPNDINITLSVGIAESLYGDDIEKWLKRADLSLYQAKRSGRNQISLYAPPLQLENEVGPIEEVQKISN